MRILITGSNGLVGGAAVEYFDALGHEVYGADNNARKTLFGEGGDTLWNRHRIFHNCKNYYPNDTDITNKDDVWSLFHRGERPYKTFQYDAVIHCAAQPSHDKANQEPQLDYDINVTGTKNMLDAVRDYSPNAVFIFTSTNKVYDDYVNRVNYAEEDTRFNICDWRFNTFWWTGFNESTPVGASNAFGQHKLEADEMVQDYAERYGMKTMVLRAGCLTGPGHSGVPLHGFLNYLIRCAATETKYQIIGHKGKQVRDNLHSYDVARAFEEMIWNPRPGKVYNLGGGRYNSISVIEAIEKAEKVIGKKMITEYIDTPRPGDHICYITDTFKFQRDYPNWSVTKNLDDIFYEIANQIYWGLPTVHHETITYPELNENSLVFDVGGCRGTWAASILKYNPKITIFEPVEEFYKDCKYRFEHNPSVSVLRFGLAEKDREIVIAKQGINSSTSRGGEGQAELPIDPVLGAAVPEKIKLVDISKYLVDNRIQNVDLMSINCEGGEYDILLRLIATGQIKLFDNVQIQFHDFHPHAVELRGAIRRSLQETHIERFNYPFVWESWKRK